MPTKREKEESKAGLWVAGAVGALGLVGAGAYVLHREDAAKQEQLRAQQAEQFRLQQLEQQRQQQQAEQFRLQQLAQQQAQAGARQAPAQQAGQAPAWLSQVVSGATVFVDLLGPLISTLDSLDVGA